MSKSFTIKAEARSDVGKGASRRLRRLANKIPAILYGAEKPPVALTLEHDQLLHALEDEAFYSSVLNIVVGDSAEQAILKDLQRHPYKPKVLHADFLRVDDTHAIHVHVPLHFINEEAAVKQGGTISHALNEVEVSCLAKDLPEFIEVDVNQLSVGQTLHLSDLALPEGVSLVALAQGDDHDLSVVSLQAARGGDDSDGESDEA